MSNFTKGKWIVKEGARTNEYAIFALRENDFDFIADCRSRKADARLIAAAPEMYRLLQNFCYPEEPYDTRKAELSNKVWELLRRIDGEEAEHE